MIKQAAIPKEKSQILVKEYKTFCRDDRGFCGVWILVSVVSLWIWILFLISWSLPTGTNKELYSVNTYTFAKQT